MEGDGSSDVSVMSSSVCHQGANPVRRLWACHKYSTLISCDADWLFSCTNIPHQTAKEPFEKSWQRRVMILCLTNAADLAVGHWGGGLRLRAYSASPDCGSDHISHEQSSHCDRPPAQAPSHFRANSVLPSSEGGILKLLSRSETFLRPWHQPWLTCQMFNISTSREEERVKERVISWTHTRVQHPRNPTSDLPSDRHADNRLDAQRRRLKRRTPRKDCERVQCQANRLKA